MKRRKKERGMKCSFCRFVAKRWKATGIGVGIRGEDALRDHVSKKHPEEYKKIVAMAEEYEADRDFVWSKEIHETWGWEEREAV